GGQDGGANAKQLGNAPALILSGGAVERGLNRGIGVAETVAPGEGVGKDTEVVGHPRQVVDIAEFLDGSLEAVNRTGRSVALRIRQGSAIETGDGASGNQALPRDVLSEQFDVSATFLVTPAPIENWTRIREGVVQRKVMVARACALKRGVRRACGGVGE